MARTKKPAKRKTSATRHAAGMVRTALSGGFKTKGQRQKHLSAMRRAKWKL